MICKTVSILGLFFLFPIWIDPLYAQDAMAWKIEGKTGTSYLVGISHFLDEADYKSGLPTTIKNAVSDSRSIFLETNLLPITKRGKPDLEKWIAKLPARFPQARLTAIKQGSTFGSANNLLLLQAKSGKIKNPELPEAAIAKINESIDAIFPVLTEQDAARNKSLKNILASESDAWLLWEIPITLRAKIRQNIPGIYKNRPGLDVLLSNEALLREKSIDLLESYPEMMETMSRLLKKEGLKENLIRLVDENLQPDSDEYADKVTHAIYAGNLSDLEKDLNEQATRSEIFKKIYLPSIPIRNKRWISRISKLLESESCPCLFSAGGAHFIGDQGLVELLKKEGYSVNRIIDSPR